MVIQDNVIKKYLKNVIFLSGEAYAGKTTIAKMLEKEFGIIRYREGDEWDRHFEFSDIEHQPAMNYDRSSDWIRFFSQKPADYNKWLDDGLREQLDFMIMDLVKLSQNQKIIVDCCIPVEILKKITDYEQVVLLLAPIEMKREKYFDREDKSEVRDFILSFPNGIELLENVKNALVYNGERKLKEMKNSGFKWFMREERDTLQETYEAVCQHFKLK